MASEILESQATSGGKVKTTTESRKYWQRDELHVGFELAGQENHAGRTAYQRGQQACGAVDAVEAVQCPRAESAQRHRDYQGQRGRTRVTKQVSTLNGGERAGTQHGDHHLRRNHQPIRWIHGMIRKDRIKTENDQKCENPRRGNSHRTAHNGKRGGDNRERG